MKRLFVVLALAWPLRRHRHSRACSPAAAPVRIILNSAPGSAADAVARILAEPLAEILGQPVLVENVAGGGGVGGAGRVVQSRRDGTTILSAVSGALIGPMLDSTLPYQIGRDLVPVSQITAAMAVFVVRAQMPVATLQEFVARSRDSRELLAFGNYGYGSSSHLQGMLLARQTGLEVEPVPFNGTSQFISELLGGRLCCGFIDAGSAREYIRSGQLRPLGSTGPRRAPDLQEVPTLTELGIPVSTRRSGRACSCRPAPHRPSWSPWVARWARRCAGRAPAVSSAASAMSRSAARPRNSRR